MRELEVLGNGHLRLDFADWKEFFEADMAQRAGAALLGPQAPQHRRQSLPPGRLLCGRSVGHLLRQQQKPGTACLCDWKQHWQHRRPNAVACVERDLDALLNFFAVPQAHWIKVRTTNVIERAFREVRRRTRPMSSFSNLGSCDRIVYGITSHLNRSWERKPLFKFTQIC